MQDNFARLLDVAQALLKDEPESEPPSRHLEALMGLSRLTRRWHWPMRLKPLDNDSDAYAAKMEIEANNAEAQQEMKPGRRRWSAGGRSPAAAGARGCTTPPGRSYGNPA